MMMDGSGSGHGAAANVGRGMMMDGSGSGHGAVNVAALKARLAAASLGAAARPDRWSTLKPGALAAVVSGNASQEASSSSTTSHLRGIADEEGLNTSLSSFDTSGASFLGPLGIAPFEDTPEPQTRPIPSFSESGEAPPAKARPPNPPPKPIRRDCPAIGLQKSTLFGFRAADDHYQMRKNTSWNSFSLDNSGHSIDGLLADSDAPAIDAVDAVLPSADDVPVVDDADAVRPSVKHEPPSPTALVVPRSPARLVVVAALGAACAAELAARWGGGDRDVALRASGALWCLAVLAAARTL